MPCRPTHQSFAGPRHERVSIDRKAPLALVSPAFTIQNHWQGSSCKLKSKKTPPMIEKSSHRNIAEDCSSNSRTCVMM
jgi:hypothetical protein